MKIIVLLLLWSIWGTIEAAGGVDGTGVWLIVVALLVVSHECKKGD